MPRTTVDKISKMRGQHHYWQVMRKLSVSSGCFTASDVSLLSNSDKDSVHEYIYRLEKAGYVERLDRRGDNGAVLYRVAKDSRSAPRVRRDGSLVPPSKQDNMWRAMKMLGRFTVRDLAVAASTDVVWVSEVHAKDYVLRLERAGYLRAFAGRPRTYMLIASKNTGPRAPYIQRVKQVFDPNLNKVVWRSGDDE